MKTESAILKYGVTAAAASLTAWFSASVSGTADSAGQYRILADAFTVPGVTLVMAWLLVLVSEEGVFDGIGYALSYAFAACFPGMAGGRQEAYADYQQRRAEKHTSRRAAAFLWHVGAVFLLPAVIFTVMFYAA